MSYISTVSGKQFHFGDHARMVEAIDIVDIAHALGNLCRFTGQCKMFYSVAERFGLPADMPAEIKTADMAMLKLEVDHLLPAHCADELDLPGERASVGLHYWNPMYAKYAFLERFKELTV